MLILVNIKLDACMAVVRTLCMVSIYTYGIFYSAFIITYFGKTAWVSIYTIEKTYNWACRNIKPPSSPEFELVRIL